MAGTAEELKFQGNTEPCKIWAPESLRQEHGSIGVNQATGPGEEVHLSRRNSVARGWKSGSLMTFGSTAELPDNIKDKSQRLEEGTQKQVQEAAEKAKN